MTDTPAALPAGWYPDHSTPGLMRWWDGAAWTEHTAAAGATSAQGRPLLPTDRPIYSPFIWVIVLLPLLSYVTLFAWTPDFSALESASATSGRISPFAIYTPGYFLIVGVGFLVFGLTVVLAWRDNVWLKRQGVVRPFHWAFAFIGSAGSLVYVIGRSVIVRQVAQPRGLAPVWAAIGVFVAGLIIAGLWAAALTAQMVSQLPGLGE